MKVSNVKINGLKKPIGIGGMDARVTFEVDSIGSDFKEGYIEVTGDSYSKRYLLDGRLYSYISLSELKPLSRYDISVTVTNDKNESDTFVSYFITSKMNNHFIGEWITSGNNSYHPIFRKEFNAKKGVGLLVISGVGLFEAYINNEKVSNEYLTPYLTKYDQELQYFVYEVNLEEENVIDVICGNGWYKGRFGLQGQNEYFGNEFGCILELYQDNNLILSSDESFLVGRSQITMSGIYDGEEIDRRIEPEFDSNARLLEREFNLIPRKSLPVVEKERLYPKEIIITPKDEIVLDFKQNHAGLFTFHSRLKEGQRVLFEFGEVLQENCFYNENYREANSRFEYISNGIEEMVRPHFTFFGYRYVRITGIDKEEVNLEDYSSIVIYSDLDRTGYFESNNDKVNRLYQNTIYSNKSNFIDIPTDCPQRNERLGWTGDAHVFSPTASYNMDTFQFYKKFLSDLRIEQMEHDGEIGNYFPSMGDFTSSSIWGDAATIIPWTMYEFSGDERILKDSYSLMRDWVDSISNKNEDYLVTIGFTFGDWLALDGISDSSFKGATDDIYLSTMYYYNSIDILSKSARILGNYKDCMKYTDLGNTVREKLIDTYFTKVGRLSIDTQTAYVIALKFGVYVDQDILKSQLIRRFKYDKFMIKCGFVGAPILCSVLAEYGLIDLSYKFLLNEKYPSWLYEVNLGATTIWERWNSLMEDGSCSKNGMNSFNHYAYGSVCQFLYERVLGIRNNGDGFSKVTIAPTFNSRLGKVSGSYNSPSGKYEISYELNGERMIVDIAIPFNSNAKVTLPGMNDSFDLKSGKYHYDYIPENDLTQKYSLTTRLIDVIGDEKALGVIFNHSKPLYGIIMGYNEEFIYDSFEELSHHFFLGLNDEVIGYILKEIN